MTDQKPESARRGVRFALAKLDADQDRVLDELENGFEGEQEIVLWLQDVSLVTLGKLNHHLLVATGLWPPLVACFLKTDARRDYLEHLEADSENAQLARKLSGSAAESVRVRYAATFLLPAFHDAIRNLRWSASERTGDGDENGNPAGHGFDVDAQPHIGMRPALTDADEKQDDVLKALFDGFSDESAILQWGKSLNLATYAFIGRGFARECVQNPTIRAILLNDVEGAQRARVRLGLTAILPTLNITSAALAERSGEIQPTEKSTTDANPTEVY